MKLLKCLVRFLVGVVVVVTIPIWGGAWLLAMLCANIYDIGEGLLNPHHPLKPL